MILWNHLKYLLDQLVALASTISESSVRSVQKESWEGLCKHRIRLLLPTSTGLTYPRVLLSCGIKSSTPIADVSCQHWMFWVFNIICSRPLYSTWRSYASREAWFMYAPKQDIKSMRDCKSKIAQFKSTASTGFLMGFAWHQRPYLEDGTHKPDAVSMCYFDIRLFTCAHAQRFYVWGAAHCNTCWGAASSGCWSRWRQDWIQCETT